jgi:hypothetical protein
MDFFRFIFCSYASGDSWFYFGAPILRPGDQPESAPALPAKMLQENFGFTFASGNRSP